jgi:hypothetical protein
VDRQHDGRVVGITIVGGESGELGGNRRLPGAAAVAAGELFERPAALGRAAGPPEKGAEEQLASRKVVDRAKGVLMDRHGLPEHAAFEFVQKTAMRERRTMKAVAEEVISGTLLPTSAPAAD